MHAFEYIPLDRIINSAPLKRLQSKNDIAAGIETELKDCLSKQKQNAATERRLDGKRPSERLQGRPALALARRIALQRNLPEQHVRPLPSSPLTLPYDSPFLAIHNATKESAASLPQRRIAWTCFCFQDGVTDDASNAVLVAAVDQRGHLYAFDLSNTNKYDRRSCYGSAHALCRFWLVARTGVSGTAMVFSKVRRREVLVAMSDNTLHCFNIGTSDCHVLLVYAWRLIPLLYEIELNL